MNKLIGFICILALSFGCKPSIDVVLESGTNYYGEKIDDVNAQTIAEAAETVINEDEVSVKISGTIEEVCQKKGCWMSLADDSFTEPVFIKFKDYAFFVPKNAGGKKAVVSGMLSQKLTPVDELKHYAEDKGASAEEIAAITEPKKEFSLMADGVIIYN